MPDEGHRKRAIVLFSVGIAMNKQVAGYYGVYADEIVQERGVREHTFKEEALGNTL